MCSDVPSILRGCDLLISLVFGKPNQNVFQNSHKTVILRACDFVDLSVFLHTQPDVFNLVHKAVILSEALRRSIANRGLYSAESKDPGDACWQILLGAFRPQPTPEDKKSQTPSKA